MTGTERNKAERNLRKYLKNLTIAGKAFIVFGVWSAMKAVLEILVVKKYDLLESVDLEELSVSRETMFFITAVMAALILLAVFSLYAIIGIGAYRKGHGRKAGWFYLLITGLILAGTCFGIVSNCQQINLEELDLFLASTFVDLTLVYLCGDILFCSVMSEVLKKKLAGEDVS